MRISIRSQASCSSKLRPHSFNPLNGKVRPQSHRFILVAPTYTHHDATDAVCIDASLLGPTDKPSKDIGKDATT